MVSDTLANDRHRQVEFATFLSDAFGRLGYG